MDSAKICIKCHLPKFDFRVNRVKGKEYIRNTCNECDDIARGNRLKTQNPEALKASRAKWYMSRAEQQSKYRSARRQDPVRLPKVILEDCLSSDRKYARSNDLTLEFVRDIIKDGCLYCGIKDIRMTLDRIDNSKGHIQSNVNASCIRCNYTRRDMPYEAWLIVAPAMRQAREAGLFGEWTGRAR